MSLLDLAVRPRPTPGWMLVLLPPPQRPWLTSDGCSRRVLQQYINRLLSSNTTRNVQTRLPHPFLLAGSSVLQVASSYNPGLVVTRRANDLWKLYGVAVNTRGPAKLGNLSDIEAETVHSQPARGLY